ncbi:Histone-lysine N-methyltransferase SETMAR [Taenia crassiceps]|uniref:Histone-lysine N-methyltransferase SETMAR n=1 Tax=Taenia crassiceps TaxID=6207 RepID=A0ABR4QB50_9CEST
MLQPRIAKMRSYYDLVFLITKVKNEGFIASLARRASRSVGAGQCDVVSLSLHKCSTVIVLTLTSSSPNCLAVTVLVPVLIPSDAPVCVVRASTMAPLRRPVAIRRVETVCKGVGACAVRSIGCGEFVCVYRGLYINPAEAGRICVEQVNAVGHVYVLAMREFAGETGKMVFETAVDGAGDGFDALPLSSLINHSCDPNLTIVPVRVDSLLPLLALFAHRDIGEGLAVEPRKSPVVVAAWNVVDSFPTMIARC